MRAAFTAYLQAVDRWQRVAGAIGLKRQAADVLDMTPAQWIAREAEREAARQGAAVAAQDGETRASEPADVADSGHETAAAEQAPSGADGERER